MRSVESRVWCVCVLSVLRVCGVSIGYRGVVCSVVHDCEVTCEMMSMDLADLAYTGDEGDEGLWGQVAVGDHRPGGDGAVLVLHLGDGT